MSRRLAANVFVAGDDGTPVLHKSGTVPPPDVAKQITNPAAWQPEDETVETEPAVPAKKAAAKRSPKKVAEKSPAKPDAANDKSTAGGDQDTPPSDDAGDPAWRDYATHLGVTVAEDADTAAVKAELTERGLLDVSE